MMLQGRRETAHGSAIAGAQLAQSPFFACIREQLLELPVDVWPSLADLQALLDRHCVGEERIRLVPQTAATEGSHLQYQVRMHERGELLAREGNAHDLFNALTWAAFPRTKRAITSRQLRALSETTCKGNRNSEADALTLFDEAGVVVIHDRPDLAALHTEHFWQELFWHLREDVRRHMRFFIFGHGLMDQLRRPFVGLTGKGMFLQSPTDMAVWADKTITFTLDSLLADAVADTDRLRMGRDLTPVPILGIPGWWPDNETAVFYDNPFYFRAKRRGVERETK